MPTFRVNYLYAFENVDVDFAGPLLVKDVYARNGKLDKCYLLLFKCATTKVLHFAFESYSSCICRDVISAVGRFIAYRVSLLCCVMLFINDNFNLLKTAEVKDFLQKYRIK